MKQELKRLGVRIAACWRDRLAATRKVVLEGSESLRICWATRSSAGVPSASRLTLKVPEIRAKSTFSCNFGREGCVCVLTMGFFALVAAGVRADDAPPPPGTQSTDANPTLITIHAAGASLATVCEQIGQQGHLTINAASMGPFGPTITLDADQQPLWSVVDSLCTKAHCGVFYVWSPPGVMFQPNNDSDRRIPAGAIMLVLNQIQHASTFTAPPDHVDACVISGTALWEPRLDVLFCDSWSIPTVAEDENGNSLVPGAGPPPLFSDPNYSGGVQERYALPQQNGDSKSFQGSLQIALRVPANAGRTISKLSGKWAIYVPKEMATCVIDHPTSVQNNRESSFGFGAVGSLRARFGQVTEDTINYQFELQGGSGGGSAEMRGALLRALRAKALDADGKLWGEISGSMFNGNGQINVFGGDGPTKMFQLFMRHSGPGSGMPAKLIITGPASVTEIDAPYEVHDLPLP